MTFLKKFSVVLLLLTAACAAAGPGAPGGGPGDGFDGGRMRPQFAPHEASDLLPPSGWWHSPYLSAPVDLTGDQMQTLDRLQNELGDTIARLERDVAAMSRDYRAAVAAPDATAESLADAGGRLASLRDQLFRRQLELLARERAALSAAQWAALQSQLEREERGREDRRGRPGMGGPGRGGEGRRPRGGFPGGGF